MTSFGKVSKEFLSILIGRIPGSEKAVLIIEDQTNKVRYAAIMATAGDKVNHKSTATRPKKIAGRPKIKTTLAMKANGLSFEVSRLPKQQKRRLADDSL